MDKQILVYLFLASAIVTWICVIAAYIIFRQQRKKIAQVLNVNDKTALRCLQAEEQLNKINKYNTPFLVFIILFSIILLLKLFVWGKAAKCLALNVIVTAIDPVYLFSWLATLGCFIIMKQMFYHSFFIKQKCDELKASKK